MLCSLCYTQEKCSFGGKRRFFGHDKDVRSFLCSRCVQRLLRVHQEVLKGAYHACVAKELHEKAGWLKRFIEKEGLTNDVEAIKAGKRGMNTAFRILPVSVTYIPGPWEDC